MSHSKDSQADKKKGRADEGKNTKTGRRDERTRRQRTGGRMADSSGKVIPPAALTHSLCPKLGSIMCHNEAEPRPGSPETEEAEPVFHYILFSGKLKNMCFPPFSF